LGTEALGHAYLVEREALFAVHSLMMHRDPAARQRLNTKGVNLAGLVAASLGRAARTAAGVEAVDSSKVGDGRKAAAPKAPAQQEVRIAMDVISWGVQVMACWQQAQVAQP
jgi:pyruvate/2-oxoglutarate dehydrogenase complex dihydrolipoamide acyltransferase (E2) component